MLGLRAYIIQNSIVYYIKQYTMICVEVCMERRITPFSPSDITDVEINEVAVDAMSLSVTSSSDSSALSEEVNERVS